MMVGGLDAGFGDEAERAARLERGGGGLHGGGFPELVAGLVALAFHSHLVDQLGDHDVPRPHRHDDQDEQGAFGHEVAFFPQRFQAVGIFNGFAIGSAVDSCYGRRFGNRGSLGNRRGCRGSCFSGWYRCGRVLCIRSRCECRSGNQHSRQQGGETNFHDMLP